MDKSNEQCAPVIRQPSQDEILRAVASSTAIETGQRIADIEAALRGDGGNHPLVKLADPPEAATGHVRPHGKNFRCHEKSC